MIDLQSIYLELIMYISKVWDIFGLFRKFKYDVIKWCIDMLNDVCNEVKVWSIHRKGNTVLRLLLGCIDLWVSCEWDDPDSTDIEWNQIDEVIQLVRVEGGSFDWVWGLKELIRADQMDLPCHMKTMRWWDIDIIMCMTVWASQQ